MRARAKASASPSHAAASDAAEFPSSLTECNRRMFDRQDGCDVTFVVKGPGDAVETKVSAHRYVLCCRSPVLHKALQWGGKTPADKKLKENDVSAEVFREILRYMYCDELSLTLLNAVQVLQGARKYQLSGLTQRCLEFVEKNLTDAGVCVVLEQAVTAKEQPLVDLCLRHVEHHTPAVFQSSSFLDVTPDVLKRIVGLETLDVTELDLFHACVAWAHHHATVAASPSKVNVDGAVLRRHLEPLVPLIRFPTMTTSEFASFVVPMSVLTDTETCNVYKYFTCPERPEKWFETTKRKRPGDGQPRLDGGLYPEIGDVERNAGDNVGLIPSAPDLLTRSGSGFDRPPKYEESAGERSADA